MTLPYFAYGSNMLSHKLVARVQDASLLGVASLKGWKISISKRSWDGSGKANITQNPEGTVIGALVAIGAEGYRSLDQIERGYTRITVSVIDQNGESIQAQTYIAEKNEKGLLSKAEYLQEIINGAMELKLPDWYIEELKKLPTGD